MSAKNYVKSLNSGDAANVVYEWLHLVAHSLMGAKSQAKKNLVAGSNHANTQMMFVENEIKLLTKHFPDGFELEVEAILIIDKNNKPTDLAHTIHYTIKKGGFQHTFSFDAQHQQKPHARQQVSFHAIFEGLLLTTADRWVPQGDFGTPTKKLLSSQGKSSRATKAINDQPSPLLPQESAFCYPSLFYYSPSREVKNSNVTKTNNDLSDAAQEPIFLSPSIFNSPHRKQRSYSAPKIKNDDSSEAPNNPLLPEESFVSRSLRFD